MQNLDYGVLNDRCLPITFIGNTFHNQTLFKYFKSTRSVEQVSLEHTLAQDASWFSNRQFMCAVTNVSFKKLVADSLADRSVHWISVVSNKSVVSHDVKIGDNVFINHFSVLYDDTIVGNHCTIGNYVMTSHNVIIGSFSHISPYAYLCYASLGQGSCVGLRSTFTAKKTSPLHTADWCNFTLDSRITSLIENSGTYCSQRLIDPRNSLELHIL